jgi:Stage II sporulation protein E (SpoIIE)
MRKLLLLLFSILPLTSFGQSIVTISPQQCVWRLGDDPAWAATNLDETGWQPYTQWKLNPDQPRIWVRCHADLSSLKAVARPNIQVFLWAAYQLYVEGALVGSAGNVRTGNFSMNAVRSVPLPPSKLHPVTIALRITWRLADLLPASALPPLEVSVGASSALDAQRAAHLLAQSKPQLFPAIGFGVVGVLGLIAFGIFFSDPSRRELVLLAIYSTAIACVYLNYLFAPALVAYPSAIYLAAWSFFAMAGSFARSLFFFALAQRRMSPIFWALTALSAPLYVAIGLCTFLPPDQALWLDVFSVRYLASSHYLALMATSTAPFFAFWPYQQITRRMWPVAGLCLVWGTTNVIVYAVRATALGRIPGIPDFVPRWDSAFSTTRSVVEVCAMAALFALLFREQRQIALDRAVLAGEMQAASEIQRMLAPAEIDTAPGLKIDVAFHPMREVGGDFYLCRVLPDGRQRMLLGDVSGKGSAAAMSAALLLGGASSRDTDSPSELLAHLNRVFTESHVGGFATCLCADLASDGSVTLANAGHLAPYLHGDELGIPSGLPLGLNPRNGTFEPFEFTLAPSDTLTFFSDGVVEARSPSGELFGFDRARTLSVHTADHIARAAQSFGQEDDITVLTLTFAPVGVVHA